MEILNKTPFQATNLLLQDHHGRDQLVVLIKASYAFSSTGEMRVAEQQQPVVLENKYYADPENSSLKYESEATLCKSTTNLVLLGNVYGGNKISVIDIGLRTQNLKKVARVYGPRKWIKSFSGATLSRAANFDVIPLIYENAFGGIDTSFEDVQYHEYDHGNFVGKGFTAKKTGLDIDQIEPPNIEDPANFISSLSDRPKPVGFGFVSPNWEPRVGLAGTYDKNWQETRAPLLPDDFNHAFYNSASRGLIAENYFRGGELIEIKNIGGYRELRFEIPHVKLEVVKVNTTQNRTVMTPFIDTIIIEPDENRVSILWKATENVFKNVHNLWFTRVTANV